MRRSNFLSNSELDKINDRGSAVTEIDYLTSVKLFVSDCKVRNLRDQTIRYYTNELRVFRKLLDEQNLNADPLSITGNIIKENIIIYMKDAGRKTVSINTRLRAIRAYFNFLYEQHHIISNPMDNVKLLKDRRHIVQTFSVEQISKLFSLPDLRTFTGIRDYTLMMLLLETGIRASEIVGIDVSDVRLKEGAILIKHSKTYLERVVPAQKKMLDLLKKYIAIRGVAESGKLFLTIDGTPLTKRQLQNRITFYGKKARITDVRCSPHTFRHTFAKMSVQNGAGIFELQQILGHTSMEMVRVYVNLFSEDVKDKHRSFSPLTKVKTRM